MNQAVLYAVAAMVCYGLSDFIFKRAAAAGIRADHFLMAQAWFFCPLVVLYTLATGTLVPDLAALWGSVAGLFVFVGLPTTGELLIGRVGEGAFLEDADGARRPLDVSRVSDPKAA